MAAVRAAQHDAGAEHLVPLAEHSGADVEGFPADGPGRAQPAVHGRLHVEDRNAAYHPATLPIAARVHVSRLPLIAGRVQVPRLRPIAGAAHASRYGASPGRRMRPGTAHRRGGACVPVRRIAGAAHASRYGASPGRRMRPGTAHRRGGACVPVTVTPRHALRSLCVRAIRRFTIHPVLPEALAPLRELMLNLRWSWHSDTLGLFAAIDPDGWQRAGQAPGALLAEAPQERLAGLAADRRFLRRLGDATDELRDYLSGPRWYQASPELAGGPAAVAYFSPEYGITAALPQYSGGLGILAGDHLKASSDLGVPLIGVGLLYRHGYFTQSLSAPGWQAERYPAGDPNGQPLALLRDGQGAAVQVTVALPDGAVLAAQIWLAQVGRVPLLLLDSYVEGNDPALREVTDRLYGGGSDHRLRQELLLGIGGVRAVRQFCAITGHPRPEVFHTNEGHAGFLGLERIREYVSQGLSFSEALLAFRAGTVFTTHTPVSAGIDRFPTELIEKQFGGAAEDPALPCDRVLALGAETFPGGDPGVFNMAVMGLRLAQRANGVSKLHGEVSRQMFTGLWPGFDPAEVPIGSVTNGVHAPAWVAAEILELAAGQRPPGQSRAETGLPEGGLPEGGL